MVSRRMLAGLSIERASTATAAGCLMRRFLLRTVFLTGGRGTVAAAAGAAEFASAGAVCS